MKRLLVLGISLMSFQMIWSQYTLVGKVVDANEKPIESAQIYLDTINTNVLTNVRGYFQVEVPKGIALIHVYSDTYGLLSVENLDDTFVKFMYLNKNNEKLSSIEGKKQDIGYGKVDEEDTTGAIASVETDGQDMTYGFNDIYDLMRARLSGVIVTNTNKIIIRGNASFRSGDPPLFVVDGNVVSSIDYINPIDVKEISVLKDASASIYGSRGANGVILIETRKE